MSLGLQVRGLIGRQGITPIAPFLNDARSLFGHGRFVHLPTLVWLNSSDRFLLFLCWGGAALALVLVAGIAPPLTAALLWLFYLSLFNVCPLFLGYQWDVLLLETGFLAIWLAAEEPHRVALWLAWWLLFRLMFASGVVKLRSCDPTWRNLTALAFHYETQPLPTPLAWVSHQLPMAFHKASCAGMFALELFVPFLIFAPPPLCYVAGAVTIALMLGIMATGNYCFFNLLTIALSLLVFDDAFLSRMFQPRDIVAATWPSWVVVPVAALLVLLSLRPMGHLLARNVRWPSALRSLFAVCEPWHLVSGYGLFAVMTRERREIVVEGSDDGTTWQPYEFKWKPCDPLRPPRYCMPHQPRLDWQMWFAALADYRASPWFLAFLARLLENSSAVVALLRRSPFADRPPRYVRAVVYRYRFTDRSTRRRTGAWWTRERLGLYCPMLTTK